jgi:antirestriction protein ArdC
MAENKDFYDVHDYGDDLRPADRLKIEHHISFREERADISPLTALSEEQLQSMREESAAAEQTVFDNLRASAAAWEEQAAQTLLLDKAIEYVRTPPVRHTANEWTGEYDRHTVSNMVYRMNYHVYEDTKYDRSAQKSVPVAWYVSWGVYTNAPPGNHTAIIAGQERKRYVNKSDMEKYLAGRIKAYSHLFTEISPPIPQEYVKNFRVNGRLLPGYTALGEEPKQPARAADIGGVSVPVQQNTEQRKEYENMNEPLNIRLSAEKSATDGAWLKLPATADQLDIALARIGAGGGRQGKNYFITAFESPVAAVSRLSPENVQRAGLDELNFLAAALQSRDDKQTAKLNAAIGMMADKDDIHSLVDLTQNTGVYDFHPDIFNSTQLGEHTLEHSGLIQIPDEWTAAVDVTMLGELAAKSDKGIFTEYGYIAPNGEEWKPVTEIPKEYRIAPKAPERAGREAEPPGVDKDMNAAAVTENSPEQSEPAVVAAPIVLVSDNPRDRMKEITDRLEAGIKGIFNSDDYKNYLKTLSKFHNYSFNNCILIAMQKPDATHVAGFNAWRDDFKRPVMKGEKGIKIFAPAPFKTTKEVDRLDASGKPIVGKNGQREKEQLEITVPAFKIVSVFDVSQTDGEPLPRLGVNELTGSVDKYRELFAALEKASPVPVGFEPIASGAKGYYQQTEKCIVINEGMSELQNLKTAIHEIAHARIHDIDKNAPKDAPRPDRDTREVQAESVAYAVCQHYGLDTSEYSFGYVATWSGDKQLDALKASLDTIRKEADAIITEVDKYFAELRQSKEQTAERPAPEKQPEQAAPAGGDTFTIYQLKDGDETRNLRFEPLAAVSAAGLAVDAANYGNIYTAPLDNDMTLKEIFYTFNMDRPEDFRGRSLSVSDVVVMNKGGKETAFYVDGTGFKELPDFPAAKERAQEKPDPAIDLKAVADYMQKQYDTVQAAGPDKTQQGRAAFNTAVKRLEQANERIPSEHPQLKALITHAAQSPDLATLKERMDTMHSEFIRHYAPAVQPAIDTGGKAEPKAPTASQPAAAPKAPAQGENVAAIEAKVTPTTTSSGGLEDCAPIRGLKHKTIDRMSTNHSLYCHNA